MDPQAQNHRSAGAVDILVCQYGSPPAAARAAAVVVGEVAEVDTRQVAGGAVDIPGVRNLDIVDMVVVRTDGTADVGADGKLVY